MRDPALTEAREKQAVGEAAAALAEDGMRIGLGTGSTVAYFLPALVDRGLDVVCVATSPRTKEAARRYGLRLDPFEQLDSLDLAVDGADQVAPSGWLVKGGGGAHTREKLVASAAERFVVIVSADKLVEELRPPIPLELLAFGAEATLASLEPARLRGLDRSPDGGLIADYLGPVGDPASLACRFAAVPGVVEHGIFEPGLVDDVLVARGATIEHIEHGAS